MAQATEHLLRLLDHVEEDRGRLNVDRLLLHAVDDALAIVREARLQALGLLAQALDILIVDLRRRDDRHGVLEYAGDLLLNGVEAEGQFAGSRREVVAHVFAAGVVDAFEAVEHLLHAAVGEEVPGVLLHGEDGVNLAQADDFAATGALELFAGGLNLVGGLTERAVFFLEKTFGYLQEAVDGKLQLIAYAVADVHTQELPALATVLRAAELLEEEVALVGSLRVLKLQVAAHKEVDSHHNGNAHGGERAEVERVGHEITHDEGGACCDEPSTDDAQHTGDAEHGALTTPSAVGERRTHGDHEGDVGGGEGELHAGAESNEQTGEDKVDGCANLVESGAFREHSAVGIEAGVDPAAHGFGDETCDGGCRLLGAAHKDAGHGARAEHLVAFILAGEVNGCFHHVLRLFREHKCQDHHKTGQDEVECGRVGALHEGGHHVAGGVARAVEGVVAVSVETREGYADKVNEVIAGKSHGEGKGAEEHDKLEYRHAQSAQRGHNQTEHGKASAEDEPGVVGNVGFEFGRHDGGTFQAVDEEEPDDARHGDAGEDAYFQRAATQTAHTSLGIGGPAVDAIGKGEDHAGYPLHDGAQHEGDGHAQEDAKHNAERLFGVEQIAQGEEASCGVGCAGDDLDEGDGKGAAEQLEDHADGGGGGHAEGVEDVEQDDVGHHDGEEHTHHVVEGKILRRHDAVARDVHHTVAHGGTGKDADGCNEDDGAIARHLGADGGVEEIYGVVAHTDDEVEHGKDDEEYDNSEKQGIHIVTA